MKMKARIVATLLALSSLYGCNKHEDQRSAAPATDRNTEWYESHPETLKADEAKCAGEAPSLSQDVCQKVFSAENSIGAKEMHDAAARNNAASSPAGQNK
jgi:hypothetical protein